MMLPPAAKAIPALILDKVAALLPAFESLQGIPYILFAVYAGKPFLPIKVNTNSDMSKSTMVAPGARFQTPATTSPPTTAISEMMTDRMTEDLKLRDNNKLMATGMVSRADTSKDPTILIAVLITSAVRMVINMLSSFTGSPLTLAASSSKLSKKNSLKNSDTTTTTAIVTIPTTIKSVLSSV